MVFRVIIDYFLVATLAQDISVALLANDFFRSCRHGKGDDYILDNKQLQIIIKFISVILKIKNLIIFSQLAT